VFALEIGDDRPEDIVMAGGLVLSCTLCSKVPVTFSLIDETAGKAFGASPRPFGVLINAREDKEEFGLEMMGECRSFVASDPVPTVSDIESEIICSELVSFVGGSSGYLPSSAFGRESRELETTDAGRLAASCRRKPSAKTLPSFSEGGNLGEADEKEARLLPGARGDNISLSFNDFPLSASRGPRNTVRGTTPSFCSSRVDVVDSISPPRSDFARITELSQN
jgi:hypothetical protein